MKDQQYARITISIPQHLLDWIDAEALEIDRPRSWVMAKMAKEISEMRDRERAEKLLTESSQDDIIGSAGSAGLFLPD